ncbi:glutathione hydrolase 7-like isoform X1 [Centropristis striata]|uniref:glutathione hydrolase 7-like isoform X1 n=1 Tax=Centropristis striata TaxID=184440 RepID=UPI0027DF7B49|nr:glutathione hydrolase 7-like isoform X1 [Centropristis striata]
MDVSPETKLNKQSTFSYNSFSGSSRLTDGSSDFTCDLNENHDLKHLPKGVSLKQLDSGSPDLLDRSPTRLRRETDENCSSRDTLTRVYALSITFAVGVTIALSLHIYLEGSLVFVKGVVVSDHERCTALGQRVLQDRGSSVDAAITAALCLGVVHPHASGVGGGGVMLVHDVHKNETRVINFQGTAPKTLKEEMLQNDSKLKAGLQVGVPGLLRGLHHAHSLYGSLSWEDVVTRAAAVAKEGFNVSFSLAEAILKVKGEQLSQRFRDMFLPDGRALLPGSILRMSSLAAVLEAGLSDFYDGNISQEIEEEVRTNGGVLSRKDISDYSVQVEQPVECLYNESIIQVPPPQSAGEAFISALDLLEGLYLNNQTHHWDTEALKVALALASGLGDRKYNSSVAELFSDMLSKSQLEVLHHSLNSSNTSPPDSAVHSLQTGPMAGQVVVMGPDGLVVSFASSLSTPFGCGIITRSGVILNSLILDFSWPNKTRGHLFTKQRVHPGKRPLSSLMPTIVVPAWHKCGLYLALSSSGGTQSLITQVLISALSIHKEKNDSLSLRRLQPQPNRLPVDSEFPEESVQSVVQGILRSNDVITAITLPRLSDSFL